MAKAIPQLERLAAGLTWQINPSNFQQTLRKPRPSQMRKVIQRLPIPPAEFESATSALGKPRSIQLSYEGIDEPIRFRIERERL
jgi:hypothetical protein